MGERGAPGPGGQNAATAGSPATTTAAYRPLYWVGCRKIMDMFGLPGGVPSRGADGLAETLLNYALVLYTNRDVEVQCKTAIGSTGSAASDYFPSPVMGAVNGLCIGAGDYPPSGIEAGAWRYEIKNAGPQSTYIDEDNPLNLDGFVYKFAESDCNSFTMNDAGTWVNVTLADVF